MQRTIFRVPSPNTVLRRTASESKGYGCDSLRYVRATRQVSNQHLGIHKTIAPSGCFPVQPPSADFDPPLLTVHHTNWSSAEARFGLERFEASTVSFGFHSMWSESSVSDSREIYTSYSSRCFAVVSAERLTEGHFRGVIRCQECPQTSCSSP